MKPLQQLGFARLKPYGFLAAFLFFLLPEMSWGQTAIHSNDCSSATSNWTFTNAGGLAIQQGSYWLVDATGDYIISQPFDVRAYTNLSLTFKVGTYGSGANNPCIVEYSSDNGITWAATSFTSATPTSSTLISAGTWSIGTVSSSNFRLRWSWGSSSGRGVRIDDILFSGIAFTNSMASNIVTSTGFTPVSNIDCSSYVGSDVTASSLEVFRFDLQDGGGIADADAVGTILKSLTFNVSGADNLNKLALYDGTTELAEANASASTQFSGLNVIAADDGIKTLSLRATFNTTVSDNSQLGFTINAVSSDVMGSAFATGNAGGATSSTSGDENRIEVSASKLIFTTDPPASVAINTNLSVTPVVKAYDANNNLDLDYNASAIVSNSASLTLSSTAVGFPSVTFADGVYTFPADFQFTQTGSANLQVADGSITDAVSSTITVIPQYSSSSLIQAVSGSEATTISSLINTAPITGMSDGTQVWQFVLNDGDGVSDDADNLPTIYNSISIYAGTGNTVADWSAAIADVKFIDISTNSLIPGTITTLAGSITFVPATAISIADGIGASKIIGMRLSLKSALPVNSDNKRFVFNINSANTVVETASVSSQTDLFSVESDNTKNQIDVNASQLVFVQGPSNVNTNAAINPAVSIAATDANGNRDLDFTSNINVIASGATLSGSPVSVAATSGLATFSALTFKSSGTGVTLSASRSPTNDWTVNSDAFIVTATLDMYVYRSKTSGNWNNITPGNETWERSLDGITWNPVTSSTNLPSSLAGVITIQSNHEVVVAANTTVDELTISANATLTINAGVTLTISDGAGTDVQVLGVLKNAGSFTQQTGSTMVFQANSHYNHTYQSGFGKLPIATWDIASTCEVSGYSGSGGSSSTANLDQAFGNFKWNCAAQPATVQLSSVVDNIRGNFEVVTTNNKELRLSASSGLTLNIGGNFIVNNGAWVVFSGSNSSGTWAMNLAGNMQINAGGTFSHDNSTSRVTVNFNGANNSFTNTGTLTPTNINWKVNTGAQLTLMSDIVVASARTFTVNGTLNTGGNKINGSGSFILNNAGILGIGSSDGITSSGSTGNIQTTSRSYGVATYIYNGSAAQVTGNGLPASLAGITIDNTAGVTLTKNAEAASLTLNHGKLITAGASLLTMSAGAIVSAPEPDSYIDGPLAYKVNAAPVNLNFPIGKGANARPLLLNIVSQGVGENIYTAEQFEGAYSSVAALPVDITHISKIRYFSITKTGSASVTANVKLTYASDDVVTDPDKLTIVKYSGGIAEDIFASASGTTGGGTISSSDFTSFSDFVLANKTGGSNPLPVELISFTAKAKGNGIALNWETASEQNSSHFEIERSTDGITFATIGSEKAQGSSQTQKRYAFEDKNPLPSISYYRLKQVDLDGTFVYSKIELVNYDKTEAAVSLFPNPTTGFLAFSWPESGLADIKVINMLGQVVLCKSLYHTNITVIDLNNIPPGSYQIKIQSGNHHFVKKVIKSSL